MGVSKDVMLVLNKKQHINFWAKVDKTGICWEWTATKLHNGYGQFHLNGKTKLAHRISYEIKWGKIPDGLQLDHLCRTRGCVNPDHLEAVTQKVNEQRGLAVITHCPKGHKYTPDNLCKQVGRRATWRKCKTCSQTECREYYYKKKALASGTMSVMGVDVSD